MWADLELRSVSSSTVTSEALAAGRQQPELEQSLGLVMQSGLAGGLALCLLSKQHLSRA